MISFSIFNIDYSDDRSINDNITIDRDQIARNSHVEQTNENSEISHHFRRFFIEIFIFFSFFVIQYVVFNFQQRLHSIDVTFIQFFKNVFDQSISLSSHSSS